MPWAHQQPSKGSFDTTTQLSISCQHILLPQAQHSCTRPLHICSRPLHKWHS